ncbi:hypothetical protein VCRA2110O318_40067 [Vibrio crassostreae]|nr:hypothetical protein VCRA2117O328_40066 [Vibrio crassostreae]CAK2335624.1 hypothetical protein VCRA2110O318_40067 [Vibrio crassostreae]CAK2504135.1 hypothetical protein VCRA2110O319_50067 [Vibrio crassostreae]CAK2908797.1 hypothetical protein VCRA217O317_30226 [Vibrio crassostreae]
MKITDYATKTWNYINERPKWACLIGVGVIANIIFWETTSRNGTGWVLSQELTDPMSFNRINDDFFVYWAAIIVTGFALFKLRNIDK